MYLKVILKVYPILGNESEYLAKLILALNQTAPHKFKAIHDELISSKTLNKEDLNKLFKDYGLDFNKIEALSESNEITEQVKENIKLARELRINGVPAFIINGKYYPGFLTLEQLSEKVKK
jgi:protein-disulfide isomerase